MKARLRVYQLGSYPHLITDFPHTSIEDMSHVQLVRNLLNR